MLLFKFLKPGLILYFLITVLPSIGQVTDKQLKELALEMDDPRAIDNRVVDELLQHFELANDTVALNNFLNRLEKESAGKSKYFRLMMMRLMIWRETRFRKTRLEEIQPLLDDYLKRSYETHDDRFIAIGNWCYGATLYFYQQLELATVYLLKGIEGIEKDGSIRHRETFFWMMGEILFRTREYRQSIYYTLKSMDHIPDTSYSTSSTDGHNLNTIGQAYYHLGQLDSALYYYNLSDQKFIPIHFELWQGINACFAGQAYFDKKEYNRARTALQYAYQTNVNKEDVITAYALCWLGRILIMENKTDSANACLNESLLLFSKAKPEQSLQKDNYLQHTYFAKAELFRIKNRTDSFYFYNKKYIALHDSLQSVAAMSNSKIAQLRINNERNQFAIQAVLAEKSREKLTRNIIIIGITLLAMVIIIILNRQKKITQYQKKVLETEARSAKEQLGFFTQNLVEKNNMLEKLQEQLTKTAFNQSQLQTQQVINELSSQVILTEDDWIQFKNLFEKTYPGFFMKLKQAAPDITIAEQRMAALTRLDLSSKQMASMLGISIDSVYKSRHRLRQRFNQPTEDNLEDFIAGL